MTIYVLSGFNNYYNRMVKKLETINEYEPYVIHVQQDYNFTPNDGVNTQVVVGNIGNQYPGNGDYLLAVNETNEIVSRWFIIENVRDRAGQYTLTLHRDLVADHYDQVLSSPMYVEKATLQDNDPMIWNNEGVSVNQIKTNEYTLRDETDCAWIVGYLSPNYAASKEGEEEKDIALTLQSSFSVPDIVYTGLLEEWPSYGFAARQHSNYTVNLYIGLRTAYGPTQHTYKFTYSQGEWTLNIIPRDSSHGSYMHIGPADTDVFTLICDALNTQATGPKFETAMRMYDTTAPSSFEQSRYLAFGNYSNQIIQTSEGQFKILLDETESTQSIEVQSDKIPGWIYTAIKNAIDSVTTSFVGDGPVINVDYDVTTRQLDFSSTFYTEASLTIPKRSSRPHLSDAPYDMFCIPFNTNNYDIKVFCKGQSGDSDVADQNASFTLPSSIITLSLMQDLARQLDTNLLDLQLLPFCPLSGYEIEDKTIRFENNFVTDYSLITSERITTALFWATSSQGEILSNKLHLVNTQTRQELDLPLQLENKKIANECDMYRLCSPNYNGQFEFNPSKIEAITGFNVDYTYLPYSPYIHVNPIFNGLYGKDFDDARGLICQGDFSISYLSDKWQSYMVQNKNYSNIFNRQIENMELTQDIQRKQQVFNAVTGTVMGGAGGALAGSKGGPWGAVAGAVVGSAASVIGGALDVHYGDVLRSEALDYKQDMFNYQLENIQALPNSVAKLTAYTKNNKIFPVLEYYTCTDVEKRAIANKIAYNGMTVMRIGTMSEFIGNDWSYGTIESKGYIKGKLIRLETVEDDYHIINALSGELDKGVYIK